MQCKNKYSKYHNFCPGASDVGHARRHIKHADLTGMQVKPSKQPCIAAKDKYSLLNERSLSDTNSGGFPCCFFMSKQIHQIVNHQTLIKFYIAIFLKAVHESIYKVAKGKHTLDKTKMLHHPGISLGPSHNNHTVKQTEPNSHSCSL